MSTYKTKLPQLYNDIFLTDGGFETTMIFHHNIDLPHFAAFDLVKTEVGRGILHSYYEDYIEIAKRNGLGFILESPTWRASADWGAKLGYTEQSLAQLNARSIALLVDLWDQYEDGNTKMVISGCIGPRGHGYSPTEAMGFREAKAYHAAQIKTFSETQADMVTAITMTYSDEAIGIAEAAKLYGMPVAISFTLETDGNLPSGERLKDAIEQTDLATNFYPAYYMINCAHPKHFMHLFEDEGEWMIRIRGIRANASTKSHADLDETETLDAGNPYELTLGYCSLMMLLPKLTIFGGCYGINYSHIEAIYNMCLSEMQPADSELCLI